MAVIKYKENSTGKYITPRFLGGTMEEHQTNYGNGYSAGSLTTAHPTEVNATARIWGGMIFITVSFKTIGTGSTSIYGGVGSDACVIQEKYRPKLDIQTQRSVTTETTDILAFCNIYANGNVTVNSYGIGIPNPDYRSGDFYLAYPALNKLIS